MYHLCRDVPDQHPEDGGGQPRLPEARPGGADQLQQAAQGGRDHRRNTAVPEPALLSHTREGYQGKTVYWLVGWLVGRSVGRSVGDVVVVAHIMPNRHFMLNNKKSQKKTVRNL